MDMGAYIVHAAHTSTDVQRKNTRVSSPVDGRQADLLLESPSIRSLSLTTPSLSVFQSILIQEQRSQFTRSGSTIL